MQIIYSRLLLKFNFQLSMAIARLDRGRPTRSSGLRKSARYRAVIFPLTETETETENIVLQLTETEIETEIIFKTETELKL